ncbi:hypothetical protein [Scytonema sp. UIC 10036]
MEVTPKEVILYETAGGKCPFNDWLISLRDRKAVDKITSGSEELNKVI